MLGEVPHELSTVAHSKECKRSPQQFIPAGFPLHNQLPTGTEDSAIPLTTPDMVRSGRVLLTSVKSPLCSGRDKVPSPLRLETISVRNGPGPREPSQGLPSPAIT